MKSKNPTVSDKRRKEIIARASRAVSFSPERLAKSEPVDKARADRYIAMHRKVLAEFTTK